VLRRYKCARRKSRAMTENVRRKSPSIQALTRMSRNLFTKSRHYWLTASSVFLPPFLRTHTREDSECVNVFANCEIPLEKNTYVRR
jgi:hypothetical protein